MNTARRPPAATAIIRPTPTTGRRDPITAASGPTPPLLLVPGALNGRWIWQDNFQPYFESLGFYVHTLDFPSHGTRGLKGKR